MEKVIDLESNQEAIALYGKLDERLQYAQDKFKVRVSARNHRLVISGAKKKVVDAAEFFAAELDHIRQHAGKTDVKKRDSRKENKDKPKVKPVVHAGASYFHQGKVIKAKSKNQESYLEAINRYDIVVAIGPAGTGKTYLAMAAAIDALKRKQVTRIVLTRPAVEAGESLGFLPGDLRDKINPYLRPLYDALYDMMDMDEVGRHLQRGVIEVAPLAYMRGRTLNESFVVLDEGQNCTHAQMKMFLTRLGATSKAIVTGDVTQIDLPKGTRSGLAESEKILQGVSGIKFCYLGDQDVVRHRLVQEIIKAYDEHERGKT